MILCVLSLIFPMAEEILSIESSRLRLAFCMCFIDMVCDSTCSNVSFIRLLSPMILIVSFSRITTGLFICFMEKSIELSLPPITELSKSAGLISSKPPEIILSIESNNSCASWSDNTCCSFFYQTYNLHPLIHIMYNK